MTTIEDYFSRGLRDVKSYTAMNARSEVDLTHDDMYVADHRQFRSMQSLNEILWFIWFCNNYILVCEWI